MSDTYSVWLSTATFTPLQEQGSSRGDFSFILLINNAQQATLELTVEAQTLSPTALIQAAQMQLAGALQGWFTAVNASTT